MFTEREGRDTAHRSVFEKGLLRGVTFREVDVPDDEVVGGVRELDVLDVCMVKAFVKSLEAAGKDVLCDLEEGGVVDVRLEQLWSFGKRC